MSESLNILPELIEASRDGMSFYEEAADTVRDTELSKLFRRMARAKADLATELSNEVEIKPAANARKTTAASKAAAKPAGKRAQVAAWVRELHATYKDLREGLGAIHLDQVSQIEATEAELLGRVQKIRHDRDHSYVVRVLAMQYEAQARVVHEGLRARKRKFAPR